jgi:hypothetical protein
MGARDKVNKVGMGSGVELDDQIQLREFLQVSISYYNKCSLICGRHNF